jgi:type VI secretion system secreted protein VgrG
MRATLSEQTVAALSTFSSASRLYGLTVGRDADRFLVEAFVAGEALQGIGWRDLIVVSTARDVELAALLGQPATLEVSLADGTRTTFGGDINEAADLGYDGALTRYRLRLVPWMWRLSQVRNSRVWENRSVMQIVDAVFTPYQPRAIWRWSGEVESFMEKARARSYCCQYRESDLAFVQAWPGASSKPTTGRARCCLPTAPARARCRKTPAAKPMAASISTARAPASARTPCRP